MRTKEKQAAIEAKIASIRAKIDEFTLTLSELETSLEAEAGTHEYQLIAVWKNGGKPEVIDAFPTKKEAASMRLEYYRAYGPSVREIVLTKVEVES